LVNDILWYSVYIAITFGIFILNTFIIYAANNQNVFAIALPINNSYDRLVVQMENYGSYSSYFHYVDSFSDLSRDTTSSSSSDLSGQDNTTSTDQIGQDNIAPNEEIGQDNIAPNEEIGQDNINTAADSGNEPTVDTNQSSSSP
jgi:hypothetical protein